MPSVSPAMPESTGTVLFIYATALYMLLVQLHSERVCIVKQCW